MYEQIFKRIIDASQNNSLTFFVGAGVSAVSGAPKWSDLINDMCKELGYSPQESYSSDDFLRIPQMYYYSIDKNTKKYYSFLRKCFEKNLLVPNEIHKMLLRFNPCSFITTNFDELLEEAAVQSAQSFSTVACDNEISSIKGNRYILKLHGDLKHQNIVLKEEDYLNYSERFKLTETVLKAIFSMNTVVFIGYSLNDYNIKLVLNWTKSLLKDQFNAPIFINTEEEELTREELLYHESKGVEVIECKKCNPAICKDTEYIERYKTVLEAINTYSAYDLTNKGDLEAFEVLYNLLLPLNKLSALRIQDVQHKIGTHFIIGENGIISESPITNNLLNYFIELCNLSETEYAEIDPLVKEKFEIISSIFTKARISRIRLERSYVAIKGTYTFADPLCITFNYCSMEEYCNKQSADRNEFYRQAYYLAKLMRYDEAHSLFLNVAQTAFKEKDYLLYYLAQVNCNNIYIGIKNLAPYGEYDVDKIEKNLLNKDQGEQLWDKLPVEFKNLYSNLKDITSANLLYKYSYNAFTDGQKLQEAIESNTVEMGFSSSGKAMCRINDYLHFLLGNGLYLDEFTEFKTTVINLMNLLVYKYSEQNKKKLHNAFLPEISRAKVIFDEIDFYCFVEYFDSKNIVKLFEKYGIDTIAFENMDVICNAVVNLLNYYEKTVVKSKRFVEITNYQNKLKTCITLLDYMDIPQTIVDLVCQFIFKYEFRDILINDKTQFLYRQLYCKKKYSDITEKIIEDKLINYIDHHIEAIRNGTNFEVMSTSGINYCNLIYYISPLGNFHSRRLAVRVDKILKLGNTVLIKHVMQHYYKYLSSSSKAKVISWTKKMLEDKFDFELFTMLINANARLNSNIISNLYNFLIIKCEEAKGENSEAAIKVFPPKDKFFELDQVGFLCFLGVLKREDFVDFLGKSDRFDFFYQYTHFDFRKFDIAWLMDSNKIALETVAKNNMVRKNIRQRIAETILENNLTPSDERKLSKILVKYFC